MTQQRIQPNRYELASDHRVQITYETTSFDGRPRLTYRVLQGPATREFVGDELRSQQSEIGTQVTVTLAAIPDADSITLTLLVPVINLVGTAEQTFETLAIVTTQQGSIVGPNLVNGVVQSYEVVLLKGKAEFVEF